jgi:hypothetical protein
MRKPSTRAKPFSLTSVSPATTILVGSWRVTLASHLAESLAAESVPEASSFYGWQLSLHRAPRDGTALGIVDQILGQRRLAHHTSNTKTLKMP